MNWQNRGHLQEGEGFNRKVLMTRQVGMRILEQNRISGSIEFTGVLIIEGNNMNEAFKNMEVPSHDAWEPGRCRGEEKKYNNILNDFRKYIRETVKKCYGKVSSNSMDAIGASDFLTDTKESENNEKVSKNELSTLIKNLIVILQPQIRIHIRGKLPNLDLIEMKRKQDI